MFFRRMLDQIGLVFRMAREFVQRLLQNVWARFRSATSLTTQAAKMTPKAMEALAAAGKKPTKRADYVETRRLLIAKSLLLKILIFVVLGLVILYFWAWPAIQRSFLTIRIPITDERVPTYNGRVYLYKEKSLDTLLFNGRLQNGQKISTGKLYYDDGTLEYSGGFTDDEYEGKGKLYDNTGKRLYEGDFSRGLYNGQGVEYKNDLKAYEGGFVNGVREGSGKTFDYLGDETFSGDFKGGLRDGKGMEYNGGTLVYNGTYQLDVYDGQGIQYDRGGKLQYQGGFEHGERSGEGTEFYPDGAVKYKGGFNNGQYDGKGALYSEDGAMLYEGGLNMGVYEGDGTLYLSREEWKSGEFSGGALVGDMKWYRNSKLHYDGGAIDGLPDGVGTLYNDKGRAVFTGALSNGAVDGALLIGCTSDDIRAAYSDAKVTETESSSFFTIKNEEAGVLAYCSYQTDKSEPKVFRAFVYGDSVSYDGSLSETAVKETEKDAEAELDLPPVITTIGKKTRLPGTPIKTGKTYACHVFGLKDSTLKCYFEDDLEAAPVMLSWEEAGKAAGGKSGGKSGAVEQSNVQSDPDEDLVALLKKLELAK